MTEEYTALAEEVTHKMKETIEEREKLKEQLIESINSGVTQENLMKSVIHVYELESAKKNIPTIAESLRELEFFTQQINTVYLHLGYQMDGALKAKEVELQEKNSLIADLQNKQETTSKELVDLNGNHSEQSLHLSKVVGQLRQLEEQHEEITQNMKKLTEESTKLQEQLENLQAANQQEKEINERQLEQLERIKQQAKEQLEQAIEKAKIEKDRTVLNMQKQYQVQLEELRTTNQRVQRINETQSEQLKKLEEQRKEQLEEAQEKIDRAYEQADLEAEKAELEKERIILHMQKQYQQQLEELQATHYQELIKLVEEKVKETDGKKSSKKSKSGDKSNR